MNFRLKIVSKYKQVIRYEPQASFGSVVLLEGVVQGDGAASVDDEIEVDITQDDNHRYVSVNILNRLLH